ncbi:MAG: DNA-binding protein [Chthoniobacterales bacterium]|nr:DNA-binding protein [Chthoniobacterales bacterium]
MAKKKPIERARQDAAQGKAPSTQAGEFVREEVEHIRKGKHGAASAKQAIAIGLSKARRAGVKLPPPEKGKTSERTRKQTKRELKKAAKPGAKKVSATRSRAAKGALKEQPRSAASHRALSRQAHAAANKRSAAERSRAAKKAARTRAKNN